MHWCIGATAAYCYTGYAEGRSWVDAELEIATGFEQGMAAGASAGDTKGIVPWVHNALERKPIGAKDSNGCGVLGSGRSAFGRSAEISCPRLS